MANLEFKDVLWGLLSVICVNFSMYYTIKEMAYLWMFVFIILAIGSDFTAFGAQAMLFEISSVLFGIPLLLVSGILSISILIGVIFYKIPSIVLQLINP